MGVGLGDLKQIFKHCMRSGVGVSKNSRIYAIWSRLGEEQNLSDFFSMGSRVAGIKPHILILHGEWDWGRIK